MSPDQGITNTKNKTNKTERIQRNASWRERVWCVHFKYFELKSLVTGDWRE